MTTFIGILIFPITPLLISVQVAEALNVSTGLVYFSFLGLVSLYFWSQVER